MTSATTNNPISIGSVVVVGKDQVSSDLSGDVDILHRVSGRSYTLSHVGARIWRLIHEPTPLAAVRDTIAQEYDVQLERCEADVLSLVRELAAERLVDVIREPAAESA
jgi:hypothetical protein